MSFASVRTPAPTLGSIQKGAIPSKGFPVMRSGIPTVQSLGNPSVHNRVTEIKTNGTAAAPIFVRPWAQEFEKAYAEGDLLFVKKDDGGGNRRQKMHVVANLPVINYLLRQKDDKGQLIYAADENGIKLFLDQFNFFGVYLNDMDTGSRYQRLLNVTVRGRCRVPDYWNNDGGTVGSSNTLRKGSIIYLGLELYEQKPGLITNPDGSKSIVGESDLLRVVPFLPELGNIGAKIEQLEEAGRDIIPIVAVGVVHHVPGKISGKQRQREALNESEKGKLLERFEIFLRV